MGKCLDCASNLCATCYGPPCNCDHNPNATVIAASDEEELDTDEDDEEDGEVSRSKITRARRNKPDAALKDQQSTGRKRAARLYPLFRLESCEWRGKIRQGGGDNPIEGCVDGLQRARHHGPDKNTLNNDEGNVHRICHFCHNRWHAANDPDYDPNKPLKH